MAKGISHRAFGRLMGVTHRAVAKAIAAGRITPLPDGKLDPDVARAQWEANTDQSKQRDKPEPKAVADPPAEKEPKKPTAASHYQVARAMREEYAARHARLEYEQAAGLLTLVSRVRLEAYQAGRLTRDTLLNLPNKIAHELAAETDPDKIHIRLTAEFTKVLEELTAEGRRRAGQPPEAPSE